MANKVSVNMAYAWPSYMRKNSIPITVCNFHQIKFETSALKMVKYPDLAMLSLFLLFIIETQGMKGGQVSDFKILNKIIFLIPRGKRPTSCHGQEKVTDSSSSVVSLPQEINSRYTYRTFTFEARFGINRSIAKCTDSQSIVIWLEL
jgi:hypothetical protein